MKKLMICLMILFTAVLVFAGGDKEKSSEKVLNIGVPDNPVCLDPAAKGNNVVMRVMGNIHETFIEVAEDGSIISRLAESWNQIDDRTIEFTLKKGIAKSIT